nr:MAG TPA: hypothetical protein [Caudoviricetes sp.]
MNPWRVLLQGFILLNYSAVFYDFYTTYDRNTTANQGEYRSIAQHKEVDNLRMVVLYSMPSVLSQRRKLFVNHYFNNVVSVHFQYLTTFIRPTTRSR